MSIQEFVSQQVRLFVQSRDAHLVAQKTNSYHTHDHHRKSLAVVVSPRITMNVFQQ